MKVSFDNQRQQTFTALIFRKNAAELLNSKLEKEGGTALQEYFEKKIKDPISKLDEGDLAYDGKNIVCSWLENGVRRTYTIPQNMPPVREIGSNVIRYFTNNPYHIPAPKTLSPFKKAAYENLDPLLKNIFMEHGITYRTPLNSMYSVWSELGKAPDFLKPFIIGRELLQAAAAKSENAPEHLKAIYA